MQGLCADKKAIGPRKPRDTLQSIADKESANCLPGPTQDTRSACSYRPDAARAGGAGSISANDRMLDAAATATCCRWSNI